MEDPLLHTRNISCVACLTCMQTQKLVFCSSASVNKFKRQVDNEFMSDTVSKFVKQIDLARQAYRTTPL